jgi:hypothetical protein
VAGDPVVGELVELDLDVGLTEVRALRQFDVDREPAEGAQLVGARSEVGTLPVVGPPADGGAVVVELETSTIGPIEPSSPAGDVCGLTRSLDAAIVEHVPT